MFAVKRFALQNRSWTELARRLLYGFALVGVLLAFVLPPFQVPDENRHWQAAVTRTEKLFRSSAWHSETTEVCSASLSLHETLNTDNIPFNLETRFSTGGFHKIRATPPRCEKDEIVYGGWVTYLPVTAWSLAFPHRNDHGDSAIGLFYVSRLTFGLLVFLFLRRFLAVASDASQSAELSPENARSVGSLCLFAFAVVPLFVQQSFGVSADVVVNLFALSVGIVLLGRGGKKDFVLLALTGFFAACTKPVIAPLVIVIPLLAPRRRNLAIAAGVVVLCVFYFFSSFGVSHLVSVGGKSGINAGEQIRYVFAHPGTALFANLVQVFRVLSIDEWTGPLGWFDAGVRKFTVHAWKALFIASLLRDFVPGFRSWAPRFRLARVGLASILVLASMLATTLAMYLSYTQVGADKVDGVQMRYFFPQIIVLLSIFLAERNRALRESGTVFAGVGLIRNRFDTLMIAAFPLFWVAYLASIYLGLAERYW